MPGEIKQLTADEMAKLETFPLPVSGRVMLLGLGDDRYMLDCTDVGGADLKCLETFYERMKGGLYAFRYESRTDRFPHCHFGDGIVTFFQNAPNTCSVRFPIVVLPPYTT